MEISPEEPKEPTPATEEANGTAATDDEQISIFDDRDTPSNDEPTESTAPTEEAPEEPKSNRTEATDAPEAEKSDEVKDEEQVSIFDDTEEGKSE